MVLVMIDGPAQLRCGLTWLMNFLSGLVMSFSDNSSPRVLLSIKGDVYITCSEMRDSFEFISVHYQVIAIIK